MTAEREIFWNVGLSGNLVYPLMGVALGLLFWSFYRRSLLWRSGQPDPRSRDLAERLRSSAAKLVSEMLGQKKILEKPLAGTLHLILFWAFVSFLALTTADFFHHYFYPFLKGGIYLWFSLIVDIMGLLAMPALAGLAIIRYVQKPRRLDNRPDDAAALILLFLLIFSGFLVEGSRLAATEMVVSPPQYAKWSPGGWMVAQLFIGWGPSVNRTLHRVWWFLHLLLVSGAFIYAAFTFSKLTHILLAPVNIFFRRLGPRGDLVPIDFEAATEFGATRISNFTWKQLMDLDACTRCGRCQDECPAHDSGKILSPKNVIQELRLEMERGWDLFARRAKRIPAADEAAPENLVGEVVATEALWDCTTCGACVEACPVYVEHVDKMIDMRRGQILNDNAPTGPIQETLRNMEIRGHPWRGAEYLRDAWTDGMDVNIFSETKGSAWLYWVGCTGALIDRNMLVTKAFAGLLQAAGVEFGILGSEEGCCGDPARRMGHELQFQLMAQQNIELLKSYGVERIVTHCPHCYNTLRHEYRRFGGQFEVWHHSELLKHLIDEKKLLPAENLRIKATYHDPCYLGRYNRVMDAPRRCLDAIPGLERVEMARHREHGFCCGGGGGHAWMEERSGQRINQMRMQQAMQTQADILSLSCPFCLQMMEEAKTSLEAPMEVLDISEIIARCRMPPNS